MRRSIFCLALAAAILAPMTTLAAEVTVVYKNEINQIQTNSMPMHTAMHIFSNIDLTEAQKEQLSAIENPFEKDFKEFGSDKTRMALHDGTMPDRCGGDPRFQSSDGEFDPVLHQRHQQLIDARVAYLQRMSELLTAEQYHQFIRNLDSMGRVE